MTDHVDIVVVGSGNAALAAAASAAQEGASVVVVEKASEEWMGGNSRFTGGLFRAAYRSLDDLAGIVTSDDPAEVVNRSYPRDDYWADVMRLTEGYADPQLTEIYIDRSLETLRWLADLGVNFMLAGPDPYGTVNPGAAIWVRGAGRHLVAALYAACRELGVSFSFDSQVIGLELDAGRVTGVRYRDAHGDEQTLYASAVILGCGGFEASARYRTAYLGPEWDHVRVRGTRYNTGDLLPALDALGARMTGGWSDCHATPISASAPQVGNDHEAAEDFARHDYSYGLMVNLDADRFIDEGENFRLYTYAKVGRAILRQPRGLAFQVFDQKVLARLDHRYATEKPHTATDFVSLGREIGIDGHAFARTMDSYNSACKGEPADFTQLDGLATNGLTPDKTNWAQPFDEPPFMAYPVACGITFTYGGVATDDSARVLDGGGRPIVGLHAVGEIQGGLFRGNYAGGSGLMRGAVFGRIAGAVAAAELAYV